mmetsp:Transcript_34295/g.60034  ORF Transcript_34295/g.60034 Transcript_34295/m.60034 type:complete len:109 (-) Transcript_34295:3136-3462(-)
MVLLDTEAFYAQLSTLLQDSRVGSSLWLTFKQLHLDHDQFKHRVKDKKERRQARINANDEEAAKFSLLARVKTPVGRISTRVSHEEVETFQRKVHNLLLVAYTAKKKR